jgi:hypothetical protein
MGFGLKLGIKCLIALVIVAMTPFCVSASDTTTTFQTGPFRGNIDLGVPCAKLDIREPIQSELLTGERFTDYKINLCNGSLVVLMFKKYDSLGFVFAGDYGTDSIQSNLLRLGADKDTITVFERKIDGKPGAVGSGYVPERGFDVYLAGFFASSDTIGQIMANNYTVMISALKTIHVTENA